MNLLKPLLLSFVITSLQAFAGLDESLEAYVLTDLSETDVLKEINVSKLDKHQKKSVLTALKDFKKFKKNNPAVVQKYKDTYKKLIEIQKNKQSLESETLDFLENALLESPTSSYFAFCGSDNTYSNRWHHDKSYHLFLAGVESCGDSTITTFGPGLQFNAGTGVVVACALDTRDGVNVGVHASATLAIGVQAGIYFGSNGICIQSGGNMFGIGASAGLSFLTLN